MDGAADFAAGGISNGDLICSTGQVCSSAVAQQIYHSLGILKFVPAVCGEPPWYKS